MSPLNIAAERRWSIYQRRGSKAARGGVEPGIYHRITEGSSTNYPALIGKCSAGMITPVFMVTVVKRKRSSFP